MIRKGTVLILGLGNEILADDGIGIKLINELKKKCFPSDIDFSTAACGGLEIVEMMDGYREVIIIDAIKTKGGIPGRVYHMIPSQLKQSSHASNFHDVSFQTAMKFGREAGIGIPDKVDIIAIEIVEDMLFSNRFSEVIEKKYTEILDEVTGLIINILASSKSGARQKKIVFT
ncbi:MAG: hydrogenase maturation protease [Bacteroidales bacterium]|jgi:hydrogenase maturation protease